MTVAIFFTLAMWAMLLEIAFSLPARSSTKGMHLVKRAGPQISGKWADEVKIAQIQQGIVDACILAHAGFFQVSLKQRGSSRIYDKYFPNANNGFDLTNVATVLGNIIQGTFGGSTNRDCADLLSQITISPDFPNPRNDNKLSCVDGSTMASMRYARSDKEDPIMVICANALKHGNIGPHQITVRGQNAPPPVTCDMVGADGPRTTYRMSTLGSIILHEYTLVSHLRQVTSELISTQALAAARTIPQPFGTQDFLTNDDVPAIKVNKREFFYGPKAMQRPYVAATYGTWMGNSYAWMASEAMWSTKCNVLYAPSIQNDDADPAYGGKPGTENYSTDLENDGSWPT